MWEWLPGVGSVKKINLSLQKVQDETGTHHHVEQSPVGPDVRLPQSQDVPVPVQHWGTGRHCQHIQPSNRDFGNENLATRLTNSTHSCCYSGKVIVAKLRPPPSSHMFMFFIPGPVEGQNHLPQQESLKKSLQHSPINANHTI